MKFRLLQAREPGDMVRDEERDAFAARLDVSPSQVLQHDLLSDPNTYEHITEGVDAVLVGGSGDYSIYDDVPWMSTFIDVLGKIADEGFPTFASCFGFQGFVVALGGVVEKDESRAEVGTFEIELLDEAKNDPLFRDMPSTFLAQLGHKDHAMTWPSRMTLLARSERCPYQAARIGDAPIYATQFHPELTLEDNLLRLRRYRVQYTEAFGVEGYLAIERAFVASPHATTPLRRFRDLLEAHLSA